MALADEQLDDDFRCAVWTAAQGYDPIGSATRFDRLVTVEVPQPWPSDIGELDWLAGLDVPDGTRLQAIVAESGRVGGDVLVTRWERSGASFVGTDWSVPATDVPATMATLVAGDEPDVPGESAPAEILICGHGTRDRCCGGPGTRLTAEARAAIGEIRVRRTSHLGGHRYAPTALTLPDGRMWAYLDAEALTDIVRRSLPAPQAREFYRGNVALDPWAQTVEGAVLEERGWSAVDFDEVSATTRVEGDCAHVKLQWTSGGVADDFEGTVEIVQRYPVLQCGMDPSNATKTAPEYRLTP